METFLIAVLTLGGTLFSMISASLQYISLDQTNDLIENDEFILARLHKLKLHSERYTESFLIIEILFYTVSALLITNISLLLESENNIMIYIIIFYLLGAIFLRTVLSSLGRHYAKKIIKNFGFLLRILVLLSTPIVSLHNLFDKLIIGTESEDISRDELNAMVETAHEDGTIDQDEYRILKSIMHFSDVLVSDVMTPRTVVFSCEAEKKVSDIINLPELQMYSRFPIWEGESIDDKVIGYVMSKDVLHAALMGNTDMILSEFAREVDFIPENAELDFALERFLQGRSHLFLVVDEYGGVEGLLTMEDVLETMLGVEIVDEADKVVDLRKLAMEHRDKRIASMIDKAEY